MKSIRPVKLITGSFAPEEAREILLNLINSKIHFHTMKSFSEEERLGRPHKPSLKRIAELKKSAEQIARLLTASAAKGKTLRLESAINIVVED